MYIFMQANPEDSNQETEIEIISRREIDDESELEDDEVLEQTQEED